MYIVNFIGMDRIEHEEEFATVELAMTYATEIEELGAQCIMVTDPEGDEVVQATKEDIEVNKAYDDMNRELVIDKTEFEGGKYTLELDTSNGKFKILRHNELWVEDPSYSKMLIGIMYEVSKMRKILSDIKYDFDPDKGQLGPPCGPEMLARIQDYEDNFNVDLRYIKDIND